MNSDKDKQVGRYDVWVKGKGTQFTKGSWKIEGRKGQVEEGHGNATVFLSGWETWLCF